MFRRQPGAELRQMILQTARQRVVGTAHADRQASRILDQAHIHPLIAFTRELHAHAPHWLRGGIGRIGRDGAHGRGRNRGFHAASAAVRRVERWRGPRCRVARKVCVNDCVDDWIDDGTSGWIAIWFAI
jgi:hypothetical protein